MSILGSIFRTEHAVPDPFDDPRMWTPSVASVRTISGEPVSPDTALALGTYWACLMVLSQDVAKTHRHLYRRKGDQSRERVNGDSRYALLHDAPNPEMSDFTFVETVTHWAAGWGNGYAEIVRDGAGKPTALYPIHPSRVTPKRDKDTGDLFYRVRIDDMDEQYRRLDGGRPSRTIDFRPEDVFHIRGMGNALEGYSVARFAAETLGHAMAVRKFGAAFFGNGANSNLVIRHPEVLSDPALAHLRSSFAEQHAGSHNAFKPFILEEGMEVEKFSIPPNEAQFLETMRATVPEVCQWFRMPPHMVGHLDNAIKANIEEQTLSYVPNTVTPWTKRWDKEANRKLLFNNERATLYFEHDLKSLLLADSKARGEFYKVLRELGAISGNEIRAAENMDSMGELGDVFLAPVNYGTLDRIVNGDTDTEADARKAEAESEAADLNFRREVVKQMVADGTLGDVVFNMTNGRDLLAGVNIPVIPDAEEPWLPVVAASGPLVNGAVITDADGAIVGGDVEQPPAPTTPPAPPTPPTTSPERPEPDGDTEDPDRGERMEERLRVSTKATMRLFVQAADRTLGKLDAHEKRKGPAAADYLGKLAGEMAENMEPAATTLLELLHGVEGMDGHRPAALRRLDAACAESIATRNAGMIAMAAQIAVSGANKDDETNADAANADPAKEPTC